MAKLKTIAKAMYRLGYKDSPMLSEAIQLIHSKLKYNQTKEAISLLTAFMGKPEDFSGHELLGPLVDKYNQPPAATEAADTSSNQQGIQFAIFGKEQIGAPALNQMYQAAKLPISLGGAIMPDGHTGYGLPIGGVLATDNAVIPYGVGLDIGCRMCLSIYDLPPADLQNKRSFFVNTLKETTLFGSSAMFKQSEEHPVMDHPLFFEMPLLKNMHAKAWKQLGSSGSGNHFVEFGIVDLPAEDTQLGLQAGSYLGVLSHSGSRALGAKVAQYYTNVAISKRRLAQEMKQLAWLYLDEDAGAEYWAAMNLAGDYATACHQVIHNKISKLLGRRPVSIVENHHNFAWKENWQGREVIVHRKGATPAGAGVMGIIPGSMASPGFIVRGKGFAPALHSASHGAGRLMSRSKARNSITSEQMQKLLQQHGITLLGGGIDEAPFAYKDIHTVMQQQTELVDVVGSFFPKIVRMADN